MQVQCNLRDSKRSGVRSECTDIAGMGSVNTVIVELLLVLELVAGLQPTIYNK
jgi:hypothetical protein